MPDPTDQQLQELICLAENSPHMDRIEHHDGSIAFLKPDGCDGGTWSVNWTVADPATEARRLTLSCELAPKLAWEALQSRRALASSVDDPDRLIRLIHRTEHTVGMRSAQDYEEDVLWLVGQLQALAGMRDMAADCAAEASLQLMSAEQIARRGMRLAYVWGLQRAAYFLWAAEKGQPPSTSPAMELVARTMGKLARSIYDLAKEKARG